MKIRVTLKDPDTMQDAVDDAMKALPVPAGVTADEFAFIGHARANLIKQRISDRWMEYGEYLVVDFTLNEDGTPERAEVVPLDGSR